MYSITIGLMSIIETMLKKLFCIKYVILIMLSSFCKTVFIVFHFSIVLRFKRQKNQQNATKAWK